MLKSIISKIFDILEEINRVQVPSARKITQTLTMVTVPKYVEGRNDAISLDLGPSIGNNKIHDFVLANRVVKSNREEMTLQGMELREKNAGIITVSIEGVPRDFVLNRYGKLGDHRYIYLVPAGYESDPEDDYIGFYFYVGSQEMYPVVLVLKLSQANRFLLPAI